MKRNSDGWIKTAARDIVSIGGIPFFILVLVRVFLLDNPLYFNRFLLSGIIFLVMFLLFKQNVYLGLGLIVLVFTAMYYEDIAYTIFGIIGYVFLLAGLFYLKEDVKRVVLGILIGVVSIGVSFIVLR